MELKVGENIKNLRKERKLTQVKLAEYLGVSFQTISKWENETAYPDITFLPSISNFFNVSIDKLFKQNVTENDLYIDKIYNECYNNSKDIEKEEVLLREILQKFPGNFKIMQALIKILCQKNKSLNSEEILCLGNKIIDDCTDDKLRWLTMIDMIYVYKNVGNLDKAKEIIDRFPSMTNEDLLLSITTDSDKEFYINAIKSRTILRFSNIFTYLYKESKDNDYQTAIKQIDKFINLHKLLYGNELRHLDFLITFIIRKANLLIRSSNTIGAIECIKQAYDIVINVGIMEEEKIRLKDLLKTRIYGFNFDEIKDNQYFLSIVSNLESNV
ncbi:MAG: hypothetical protein K0Q49_1554 [Haloplasmataceae bacterium]|jgi:transcriptional regulator with XRE-family HTH domain|nr:hypothetical protein [Haloplasmataceae bacterium]